jgi:hypothetical protein
MNRIATIILNRNLPEVTDRLCNHLMLHDGDQTDVYVVEAGSDNDRLSKYASWHADWTEAYEHGLRYSRGMNFGLSQLWNEGKFKQYDAFFLLTNDAEFQANPTLAPLISILDQHPRVGILSPCAKQWGERLLLQGQTTKYFWFIHNSAYLLRREFIESIMNVDQVDHMGFVFDGSNFRGYGSETELIAKAYANDWAAAITAEVWASENESHLRNQAFLIKTETYEDNLSLYVSEGRTWLRNKYGFNSRWSMQQYVKNFYDAFFEFHPEFSAYKI